MGSNPAAFIVVLGYCQCNLVAEFHRTDLTTTCLTRSLSSLCLKFHITFPVAGFLLTLPYKVVYGYGQLNIYYPMWTQEVSSSHNAPTEVLRLNIPIKKAIVFIIETLSRTTAATPTDRVIYRINFLLRSGVLIKNPLNHYD